tara:strand:+ start:933 stop:1160 length:228 start_codon:yes stop_codon:yes gene_type:complete
MSFLKPKVYIPPAPPPPPPPAQANDVDTQKAVALAEEATKKARKKKGAGSTIVAGALTDKPETVSPTGGTPTLLG